MKKTIQTFVVLASLVSASAEADCVKVAEANLRKGPGTQHEKSWVVYKYMPLKQISKDGSWFQVKDVDGDKHWVFSKLLTDEYQCAVVKVEKANVRSGPGIGNAVAPLGLVERYYAFKVVSEQSGWVEVEDEMKNHGWISKSLVWMN